MVAVVVEENRSLQGASPGVSHSFGRIMGHALVSVILILLGGWAFYHNLPLRSIRFDELEYSKPAAQRLKRYPTAQYAYGMQAWSDQQSEKAASSFLGAISQNVLFIDAWLRLAETQAAMGHAADAMAILEFVARRTDRVLRWKWPQMVLAQQLGMDAMFYRVANDLLTRRILDQDALQLLHTHLDGNASAMLDILNPQNLEVYLDWLMRWGLAEESLKVWQALTTATAPTKDLALRYAHFLLGRKRTVQAAEIWRQYTGRNGLSNPGFEAEIAGQGFDWCYWGEQEKNWELKRVRTERTEGDYALQLTFNGKENVVFLHFFQIFPVTPGKRYRLTYAWKTRGITTDQGPYVEVAGYDPPAPPAAGPMMTGTHGWQEDTIAFTPSANCHAMVVRLRRIISMRFDSKIRGKVWLDNFRLEDIPGPQDAVAEKNPLN